MKRILFTLVLSSLLVTTGCAVSGKQTGRHLVPPGQAEWIVFMLSPRTEGSYICSGSIISPSWILTAAHCAQYSRPLLVDRKGRVHRVQETFVHPSSAGRTPDEVIEEKKMATDLALMRLDKPIQDLQPVQLPHADQPIPRAGILWGYGPGLGKAGRLYWSEPLMRSCSKKSAQLICLSQGRNQASQFTGCQGDSGGPVTSYQGRSSVLWAVNSFAAINPVTRCTLPLKESFYGVDLRPRLSWIKSLSGLS